MRLETALRYTKEINQRVRSINGLLATPLCAHEAMRISRIWVFGSTVKGSAAPNDLDLLIEMRECGRRFSWKQTTVCKEALHRYGVSRAPDSMRQTLIWLTKGMRRVSRHVVGDEGAEIDVKRLIYPRYDL